MRDVWHLVQKTSFFLEIDKTKITLYTKTNVRKEHHMVTVTEIAQEKIGQVLKENKNEEKGVRVFLYGGG